MSDLKLYKINGEVKELSPTTVNLEKELQTLIEKNMDTMFGVRFLDSEFVITNGRMDSIGIDENNCPVIFEYKRSTNENVINQGLFYLDWLLDHKADFKLLVMDKLGEEIADEVDWTAPCVICIANNFNKFDLHAVNQMQRNIKLVKYKKYDDLILFEHLNAPDFVTKEEKMLLEPVSSVRDDSFETRYEKASENVRILCSDIENYIESLGDDISKHQTKFYIAFKKVKNIVCMELFQKYIILTLKLDPKDVNLEEDFVRDISNVGHHGTGDVEVKIRNNQDFERSKELLDRAYNEN